VASKLNNVLYLAVIRVDGQCIVASYGQPKYESTVNQVVNAPAFRSKVGTGQRIRKFIIFDPPVLQKHSYQLTKCTLTFVYIHLSNLSVFLFPRFSIITNNHQKQ
jgi:hypothetical protein